MALISLQNVTLRFGGPAVLQDANLQLEAGEETVRRKLVLTQ